MLTKMINSIINRDGTDRSGAVRDLLTDLMHFCDEHGIDFETRRAAAHQVYLDEQTWMVKSQIKPNHYWSADKSEWVRGKENATAWTGEMIRGLNPPPFGEWERTE